MSNLPKTISNLPTDTYMQLILDRSQDINAPIAEARRWWKFDLYKRHPGPAYESVDGQDVFVGTDLDMLTLLIELSNIGAVIRLPGEYKGTTTNNYKRTDQVIVSKEDRRGKLLGLKSSQEVFSFSVLIEDVSVMSATESSDFRTFNLTDKSGQWYTGWESLSFIPTPELSKFIDESEIAREGSIVIRHFVHPNRWKGLYGRPYILTKVLLDRLSDESKWLNKAIKTLIDNGVKYPKGEGPKTHEYEKVQSETKKVKVDAMEVEIDTTGIKGEYKYDLKSTPACLVNLYETRKKLLASQTYLRLVTRATELAFFNKRSKLVPANFKGLEWEEKYRLPRARKEWDRLSLVGDQLGIRVRYHSTSVSVPIDYEGA